VLWLKGGSLCQWATNQNDGRSLCRRVGANPLGTSWGGRGIEENKTGVGRGGGKGGGFLLPIAGYWVVVITVWGRRERTKGGGVGLKSPDWEE